MAAIVLESGLGSQYEDTPDSYEFQSRYLRFFDPLRSGDPLFAVVYEPRGEDQTGRMAYVALAEIASVPVSTGRRNRAGEELWRVSYRRPAEPFENAVPREMAGRPVETWLAGIQRGRPRNVATFGRAVRPLSDEDFETILLAAGFRTAGESEYQIAGEHRVPLTVARERVERLVAIFERGAAFRRNVLTAYAHRCAVTGLGIGPIAPSKTVGLLDAAHIRPVRSQGTDELSNGLPLTPTLHRLFDAGFFTVRYVEGRAEVLASTRLDAAMIEVPERNVRLSVATGVRLIVPTRRDAWPSPEQLLYHQRRVFISSDR